MTTSQDSPPKQAAATTPEDAAKQAAADEAKEKAGLEPVGSAAMEFLGRALNRPPEKAKKEKKAPEATLEEDDDDAALEQPPPKKPAKKVARAAAPPPPPIDEVKLGEAVGRAVAEATKKKEPEPPAPDADLTAADKRRLAVLSHMEKQQGERYKGLPDRFVTNLRKHREYAAKWEQENPGEKYDEKDEQHAEFLDALEAEVEYDEDDYVEALTDIKVNDKVRKVDEQVAERLKPIETQERLVKERPKIIANRDKIGNRFWERMGDEFADVLAEDPKTKAVTINNETLKTLAETDPDTHRAVVNGAQAAEFYATETYLLDNGLTEYVGDKQITETTSQEQAAQIQAHKFLSGFVTAAEQRMTQRPPEKQRDTEGRTFAPRADYNRLQNVQRANYWTFSHEDIGYLVASDIAKQTKAYLQAEEEKFSRRAAARGVAVNGDSSRTKPKRRAVDDDENDDTQTVKPVSPSTTVGPRMAPQRDNKGGIKEPGLAGWALRAIRGS